MKNPAVRFAVLAASLAACSRAPVCKPEQSIQASLPVPAASPAPEAASAAAAQGLTMFNALRMEPLPWAYYAYLQGAEPDRKHLAEDIRHAAMFLGDSAKFQASLAALPPGQLTASQRQSLRKNRERVEQTVKILESRADLLSPDPARKAAR